MRSQYVLEGFRNSCCGLDLWCLSDTHDHDELAQWIHTGTESLLPFREEPLSQAVRLHPKSSHQRAYLSAVLPVAREQGKDNYRYLFFQSSPQPVFGRLEQGDSGPLTRALGKNTVFMLGLSLWAPWRLWGWPLRGCWGQSVRTAGWLKATVSGVPWAIFKFGVLNGHGLFGVAVAACFSLVSWWMLHVTVVPAPVLAVAVVCGPP